MKFNRRGQFHLIQCRIPHQTGLHRCRYHLRSLERPLLLRWHLTLVLRQGVWQQLDRVYPIHLWTDRIRVHEYYIHIKSPEIIHTELECKGVAYICLN